MQYAIAMPIGIRYQYTVEIISYDVGVCWYLVSILEFLKMRTF